MEFKVEGFPNYKITDRGVVRSLDRFVTDIYFDTLRTRRMKGRVLKHMLDGKGYPQVTLYPEKHPSIKRKGIQVRIHRLIAEHFILNPLGRKYVNHKNGNKLDFSIINLEWCTHQENCIHALETGLKIPQRGEEASKAKLKQREVEIIIKAMAVGVTNAQLARAFKVDPSTISNIKRGKTWRK